jgi:hypothetical protein
LSYPMPIMLNPAPSKTALLRRISSTKSLRLPVKA